jgi:opacity protein-like surface antigen
METFKSLSSRLVMASLSMAVLGQSSAAAQDVATWHVTPAAGIGAYRSWDVVTSAVGISVDVRVQPLIVAEVEFLRLDNLLSSNPDGDVLRAFWIGGNVLIPLRRSGWRPFGLGGIGVGRLVFEQVVPPELSFLARQSHTDVAFNAGGGVMIPVSPRVSVRTDLRWLALFDGDSVYNVTRLTAGVGLGF